MSDEDVNMEVGKKMTWWKLHKGEISYIYNCFSGSNGQVAYGIAGGVSVLLFLLICFVVNVLNSLSVLLIDSSLFLIIIHLDLLIDENKLPWKGKQNHIQYQRFKRAVLMPIQEFRESLYDKVGILSKNAPPFTTFYIMLLSGVTITTLLSIIPVKFFSFVVLVVCMTIPQIIRKYVENDVLEDEKFRKFIKEQLKEYGLYVPNSVKRTSTEPKVKEKIMKAKQMKAELIRKSQGRVPPEEEKQYFTFEMEMDENHQVKKVSLRKTSEIKEKVKRKEKVEEVKPVKPKEVKKEKLETNKYGKVKVD